MFRPYSKEQQIGNKKEKKETQIKLKAVKPVKVKPKKKKAPPRYMSSNGKTYSQVQIDNRRSKEYKNHPSPNESACQCCGKVKAEHRDHTISQRACKILHKVEFIWYALNWSLSCSKCHTEWESYKSGLFTKHINFIERMLFMKEYDPEGFRKRLLYVHDKEQLKQLSNGTFTKV